MCVCLLIREHSSLMPSADHASSHALQVAIGSLNFPNIPENQDEARRRFQRNVKQLSGEHAGSLLFVTHGDAVGAVVEKWVTGSLVYQVDTTGYVVLTRHEGGFSVGDADGVSWMDD